MSDRNELTDDEIRRLLITLRRDELSNAIEPMSREEAESIELDDTVLVSPRSIKRMRQFILNLLKSDDQL